MSREPLHIQGGCVLASCYSSRTSVCPFCHNQNKCRQAMLTMGIRPMLSPATASRKAAKITARANRALKRLNPTRSTESQEPPIIWPFTRAYSCLKSEPAIPISTKPAMFIRSLTTDSLSSNNPLRELPEVTITFNISQSLGIDIESYLGLVLDQRAIVKRVLGSTQAASANIQPSWKIRWIALVARTGTRGHTRAGRGHGRTGRLHSLCAAWL